MASPYQLYFSPGSASLAVHWMLIDLDLPHELARVDLAAQQHKEESYLKLNPNGLVPTLMIDGAPVYECAALLMLLAERHPEKNASPPVGTPERTRYLQWMMHFANTVQPAFRTWFYPHEAAGEQYIGHAQDLAQERIAAAWGRADAHLSRHPYFAGEHITAVDFLGAMLMRWSRNHEKPATAWPALADYVRRMRTRPSFAQLYEREGLTEWMEPAPQ
jgi:glutathione S-transferase